MIHQPDRFVSLFRALGGSFADLRAVPSAALRLVNLREVRQLFVSSTDGRVVVVDFHVDCEADAATARFVRALYAAFVITWHDPVVEWEESTLPFLAHLTRAALGDVALNRVWIALSIFRLVVRGGGGPEAREPSLAWLFPEKRDRVRILSMQLCCERPDDETFSLGNAGALVDELELSDADVRHALATVWPVSTVWDDHLRALASG